MGLLDDRIGGKRTIVISLLGLIASALLALCAAPLATTAAAQTAPALAFTGVTVFWSCANGGY